MEKLQQEPDRLFEKLPNHVNVRERLQSLCNVYPFNKFEFIISHLLVNQILSHDDYNNLRQTYIDRNKNLFIFQITAPTSFGISWAYEHLKILVPDLVKPSKKLNPNYSGEYDFLLDNQIRIEVKASRAVDKSSKAALYEKALHSNSLKHFEMNFQQKKPHCCDVFIWIAVWLDIIRYWIFSSNEIANSTKYSNKQHRYGRGEGQLHVTDKNIRDFQSNEVLSHDLANEIRNAYQRQIEFSEKRQ